MKELASMGQIGLTGLLNPRSAGFRKLGLDLEKIGNKEAARLIEENPRIMRRPLLTDGNKMVIGFDPGGYAELADY
ncbi:MAG TPA: hypothetical protein ENN91_02220 [Firmicutes bacterium]|nr:hypothetical protein [Bacillota bacterium]